MDEIIKEIGNFDQMITLLSEAKNLRLMDGDLLITDNNDLITESLVYGIAMKLTELKTKILAMKDE
jgi:hypothetical protein